MGHAPVEDDLPAPAERAPVAGVGHFEAREEERMGGGAAAGIVVDPRGALAAAAGFDLELDLSAPDVDDLEAAEEAAEDQEPTVPAGRRSGQLEQELAGPRSRSKASATLLGAAAEVNRR